MLTGRYIFPSLLRYYIRHYSKKFYEGRPTPDQYDDRKKEGEMHIDNTTEKKPKADSGIGEYVDFEEIK